MTGEALLEALRPLVVELVRQELEQHELDRLSREPAPYLTVTEYAERHRSTPAAVRARIRRHTLQAIRPPGSREYLIPNDEQPDGRDDVGVAPGVYRQNGALFAHYREPGSGRPRFTKLNAATIRPQRRSASRS
jgi:hypothetical protein